MNKTQFVRADRIVDGRPESRSPGLALQTQSAGLKPSLIKGRRSEDAALEEDAQTLSRLDADGSADEAGWVQAGTTQEIVLAEAAGSVVSDASPAAAGTVTNNAGRGESTEAGDDRALGFYRLMGGAFVLAGITRLMANGENDTPNVTTPNVTTPSVTGVGLASAVGAQNDTLNAGDVVTVTLSFSEAVTITGAPQLTLRISGAAVNATYAAGSGTATLTFTYTIQAAQTDLNGISIDANSLALNGGTIKNAAGIDVNLTHNPLADQSGYLVDTTAPSPTLTAFTSQNTGNATVQSSETGTAYLVRNTVVVNTLTDITSAADANWNSTAIITADSDTTLSLAGLLDGTYRLYTLDAAGNLSAASGTTGVVDTTAPSPTLTAFTSQNSGNATVQSSETGTAYLVRDTVVVNTLADIISAADANWNSTAIITADSDTTLSLTGLIDGTYRLYTLDAVGNLSAASVTTGMVDSAAPTLQSSTPADGGVISATANLTLTFNENIVLGTGNLVLKALDGASDVTIDVAAHAGQLVVVGNTLTINSTADLDIGKQYAVQVAATALRDATGNAFTGIADTTTLNFTTSDPSGAINLASIAAGTGGFAITGQQASDLAGSSVALAGDVNGDGLDDLIIGAEYADIPGGNDAGRSYVVFGRAGFASVDLNTVAAGTGGFVIYGEAGSDNSGHRVSGAGDVNGDGLADLIVGAWGADPGGVALAGRSYVVFGKADGTAVNLTDITAGTGGFVLSGQITSDYVGVSVSGAGDLNRDGLDDLIVGANNATGPAGVGAGKSFVVFGKADTAAVLSADIINGIGGFVIDAENLNDSLGTSVAGAGDVNGDGLPDFIVGAHAYDTLGGVNTGRSYVVFGKTVNASVNLDDIANGLGGFAITGEAAGDISGISVAGAGDVNGDGLADLIVGSPYADQAGNNAGRSYVVFGKADTTAIDLSAIATGTGGFVIEGQAANGESGGCVAGVGDFNGDGLADLLVGAAPMTTAAGGGSGRSYLVYGKADTGAVNLANIAAGNGGFAINGQAANDYSGISVSGAGDVNGDGYTDLLVSAYANDPAAMDNAGSVYLIYGGSQQVSNAVQGAGNVTGTAAAEAIIGSSGADTLSGGGGVDRFFAGDGNDTILLGTAEVANLVSFAAGGVMSNVDAGGGFDTIRLSGGSGIDFRNIANQGVTGLEENSRIESIERLDLASDAAANTVTLALIDVLDMAGMNLIHSGISADGNTWNDGTYALGVTQSFHQLVIDSGANDLVNAVADAGTWNDMGTVSQGGNTYDVWQYSLAAAQLIVASSVSFTVI